MGPYNQLKREIYIKERESLLFVLKWEGRSKRFYIGIAMQEI